jgi:peptidoglycan/xylan/chitin deacetylase (PgdA/CDA1 family)
MYHAVSDEWEDPLAVRVDDFERQMTMLVDRGYRGATAREVLTYPSHGNLLHVTFDDAFASITRALPTLRRLGIPCTVFVCTDFAADGAALTIPELQSRSRNDELRTLTWSELAELVETGLVEVGSHSKSHAHLPALSDQALREELAGSRAAIEENLGRPAHYLAYPFGEEDGRVRREVERQGYLAAFGAPGRSLRLDRFRLPRTGFWRHETSLERSVKTSFPTRVLLERSVVMRRRLHELKRAAGRSLAL